MIGIVGKKCGMTRVFTDDGRSVPVTIVQADPNFINKIKTNLLGPGDPKETLNPGVLLPRAVPDFSDEA